MTVKFVHPLLIENLFQLRREKKIRLLAFIIGAALACFANSKTHKCFPSENAIAKLTGTAPREVRRAITELTSSGFITVQHDAGRVNHYSFCNAGATHDNPDMGDPGLTEGFTMSPPLLAALTKICQTTDLGYEQDCARAWCVANPTKRPETQDAWDKFMFRWVMKTEYGARNSKYSNKADSGYTEAELEALNAYGVELAKEMVSE